MLVTDDEALARRARHLSTQARLPGPRLRPRRGRLQLPAVEPRRGARRRPARAAAGAARRPARERRRATTPRSRACPGCVPAPRAAWADPSFWLYTRPRWTRGGAASSATRLLDGARPRPASRPGRSGRRSTGRGCTRDAARLGGAVADDIFERAFSLPSSSSLDDAARRRVVEALAGGRGVGASSGASDYPHRMGPDTRVAVIGLGYVGLPLAIAFAEAGLEVDGVDISRRPCRELRPAGRRSTTSTTSGWRPRSRAAACA